jgi:hypothetical protein
MSKEDSPVNGTSVGNRLKQKAANLPGFSCPDGIGAEF